ncbi:hypothetical protein OLS47_00035 [Campylobacter jejuni]|nr:hypothetical protein [Campylobacter jejuni]
MIRPEFFKDKHKLSSIIVNDYARITVLNLIRRLDINFIEKLTRKSGAVYVSLEDVKQIIKILDNFSKIVKSYDNNCLRVSAMKILKKYLKEKELQCGN